jgi:diamine N-acetyltransferase
VTLPITTERLTLRRFTYRDAEDLLRFASHPSVERIVVELEATEAGVRKYIDLKNSYRPFELGKCFDLAIERKDDGRVLGILSLICRDHGQAQIGWALAIDCRGHGYATEAAEALMAYGFHSLGLHRIWADTSTANQASRRLMERLGMRQEGHLREAEFRNGEYIDTLIYGLRAGEWQARSRAKEAVVDAPHNIPSPQSKVTLREINADTVRTICDLSVREDQRKFVAPNAVSIAQAYFSEHAWFRAIYAGETPVGFLMLEDQPEKPEYYLWRFMIDARYQGMGFGREALSLLIAHLKTRPRATELLTSVHQAEGGPQGFYEAMGFELTGEWEEGEALMRLRL